jgi:hypothetical protein
MTQTASKTNKAAFYDYIDAGMMLFPCVGYSKIPAMKGFTDLPFDPEFEPSESNYGVLLKNRYLVIDCDPRGYKQDDRPLRRLFADLGLPERLYQQTFTVKTPRGGYHIYFTKPIDHLCLNTLPDYAGLEFKTHFIMACGSYIAKTEKNEPVNAYYKRAFLSPSKIIAAPAILLNKLKRPEALKLDPLVKIVPDSEVDIRSFITFCKTAQIATAGENGDIQTFITACRGRDYGLSQEKTLSIMLEYFNPRCDPSWEEEDLRLKVQNAFVYGTRNPAGVRSIHNEFPSEKKTPETEKPETVEIKYHTVKGALKKNMHNLKMFFKYPTIYTPDGEEKKSERRITPIGNYLRFDQFSHRILWTKPAPWFKTTDEWSDEDAIEFKSMLSTELSMDFGVPTVHEVAVVCASERAFHPVREYLESCKWDGIPRLDTWLSRYCGALDSEYTRFVGRKVLVAAVSRVFRPGCKFDHVMVTEGRQGLGKSYMWEVLASPWFTDAPLNIQDKSAVEILHGKWVVELAEMDALTKYESHTIKGFLTRCEDRCRMAYDRKAKNFPRQNIFVGSINPEETGWLKDKTGNRRYWPVAVNDIDLKNLKIDRDQLWAEALIAFERGEILYVDSDRMQRLMQEEISTRMQEDPWFNIIENYLHATATEYLNTKNEIVVTPSEMFTQGVGGNSANFKTAEASRVASILKTLGFVKGKTSGKLGYSYSKPYIREI